MRGGSAGQGCPQRCHADDVSATASQSQRVTSALCACDSCDERDLAVESAQRCFLVSRRYSEIWRPRHRLQDRRLTTCPEREQPLLAYQQPDFADNAVLAAVGSVSKQSGKVMSLAHWVA